MSRMGREWKVWLSEERMTEWVAWERVVLQWTGRRVERTEAPVLRISMMLEVL